MNKHVLALSTALSILAFTPAFAQDNTQTPAVDCTLPANAADPACAANTQQQQNNTTTTQQQQDQSGSGTATTTDPNAPKTGDQSQQTGTEDKTQQTGQSETQPAPNTTASQTSSGGALIVPAEQLNSAKLMSASDYIGKTVYDQAGNNIGDVNDLIISNDGQIQAVILGVGGFLGIGEKDVAVNTNAVQMVQDGDNKRLVVEATKEALNAAPTYDKNNRRYADQMNGTTTDTTGSTTAPAAPANNNNNNATGTVDCTVAANASDPACVNKTQQ